MPECDHQWRWISEEDRGRYEVWGTYDPESGGAYNWIIHSRPVNVICDKCGKRTWGHGKAPWPLAATKEESRLLSKIGVTTSEETPGTDLA